jgi:ABC-type transport system substrate-binding protein
MEIKGSKIYPIKMQAQGLFFKYVLFVCIFIGLSSCQRKAADEGAGLQQKNETNDTAKYIKIADANGRIESWSKSNTLIYHVIGEPNDMHPTNGNSSQRTEINQYTELALIATDFQTLKSRPSLVKNLPEVSANGLEYKYELRDDPRWDDGSMLSIEDVIFTFKANKLPLTNNPHIKPYLENLKDVVVNPKNKRAFTLLMKRQYIQNITFLTDFPILQKKYYDPQNIIDKYTFAQIDNPKFTFDGDKELNKWSAQFNGSKYSRDVHFFNGLGPYKIVQWEPGQFLTLVKKKDHWTKGFTNRYETSFPERIIFKINTDAGSQLLEFKTQTLDASTSLSTKTLLNLEKNKQFMENYNCRFTDTYNYSYIAMNMKPDGIVNKKFFTDKKVRKAMAMIIPVEIINKILNKGKCKRVAGPVSPLKVECNTDLKFIPLDIGLARKLLDEAGWKDTDGDFLRDKVIDGQKIPFRFNLNFMTGNGDTKDMVQIITEAMYKAGIKVNPCPLDFAVHYDKAQNHNFDMMIGAWAGNAAPDDPTQLWHSKSWSSKGSNFPGSAIVILML